MKTRRGGRNWVPFKDATALPSHQEGQTRMSVLQNPASSKRIHQPIERQWWQKIKSGAVALATAPSGNVSVDLSRCTAFPVCAQFAQSLREPLSPRSSEYFHSKLANAVLRVNAVEVKKKFRQGKEKETAPLQNHFDDKASEEKIIHSTQETWGRRAKQPSWRGFVTACHSSSSHRGQARTDRDV